MFFNVYFKIIQIIFNYSTSAFKIMYSNVQFCKLLNK